MTIKLLIIDDDTDTLRLVALMLQRQGYQITAASSGQEGLDKALDNSPNLILLDIMMPDIDGYEVARRLRGNSLTADIPILMFTAKTQLDDKMAGFEVGADDYLTKPTHPSELRSHIKVLLTSYPKSPKKTEAVQNEQGGYVIGLIAARGGIGVSTLASNLAASLSKHSHSEVVLAELTPGQGSLGLALGNKNDAGLENLLMRTPAEITGENVAEQLVPIGAGFKLLTASNQQRNSHLINQVSQYESLVKCLSTLGRYIILDLGLGMPPSMQGLLPLINEIFVVVEGNRKTIPHTRALMDDLIEFGTDPNDVTAILNNRVRSVSPMPWVEVQKQLGHSIVSTLTPAPELFAQAAHLKAPAVLCHPDSQTAGQFNKLVERIAAYEVQTE